MQEMRIVGLVTGRETVMQVRTDGGPWKQTRMDYDTFTEYMRATFPADFREYEKKGRDKPAPEFFYNYGETAAMRRKGEAYIYR